MFAPERCCRDRREVQNVSPLTTILLAAIGGVKVIIARSKSVAYEKVSLLPRFAVGTRLNRIPKSSIGYLTGT